MYIYTYIRICIYMYIYIYMRQDFEQCKLGGLTLVNLLLNVIYRLFLLKLQT